MSVMLTLPLFGKPGHELEEGSEVTGQQLRDLGQDLAARLAEAADLVDQLTGAGWEAQLTLYDVMLSHPYVETEAEARSRLDALGIDPDRIHIDEFDDEPEDLEGPEDE
jgi:hypothetical protein